MTAAALSAGASPALSGLEQLANAALASSGPPKTDAPPLPTAPPTPISAVIAASEYPQRRHSAASALGLAAAPLPATDVSAAAAFLGTPPFRIGNVAGFMQLAAAPVSHMNSLAGGALRFRCSWPLCAKTFRTKSHVRRHEQTHTAVKYYTCPIQDCVSTFTRHDNMISHYKLHTRRLIAAHHREFAGSPDATNYRPSLRFHIEHAFQDHRRAAAQERQQRRRGSTAVAAGATLGFAGLPTPAGGSTSASPTSDLGTLCSCCSSCGATATTSLLGAVAAAANVSFAVPISSPVASPVSALAVSPRVVAPAPTPETAD